MRKKKKKNNEKIIFQQQSIKNVIKTACCLVLRIVSFKLMIGLLFLLKIKTLCFCMTEQKQKLW